MSGTRYFMVFIVAIIAAYAGGHVWIYLRCMRLVPWWSPTARALAGFGLALLALSYPLGRLWEARGYQQVSEFFAVVGSVWIGVFIYAMIGLVVAELGRLFGVRLPIRWVAMLLVAFVVGICGYGYYSATHPRVTTLSLTSSKIIHPVKLVFISDIHLGAIIRDDRLQQYVDRINHLRPDAVIIGGDIVDESVANISHLDGLLRMLDVPDGVYAVTGNHDYYAGIEKSLAFMDRSGIRVLRGETVCVKGVNLVGIDDVTGAMRYGEQQPELSTVLRGVDFRQFTILISHQPRNLRQAADAGVDLTLSGHTHDGQLWPFGYLTKLVFPDLSIGRGRFDHMEAYVSSGLGTWGPPFRVGTTPEIVVIELLPIRP